MKFRQLYVWILPLLIFSGCTNDHQPTPPAPGYPEDIGLIMQENCAVSGCHNSISAATAGGLDLSSWDALFEGSYGGAAVVPYRSDQSFLFYFINTDPSLGPTLSPTMPFNDQPLTRDQILKIRNWIDNGAPSKDGQVKWTGHPTGDKFYLTNQGCDLVAVMDANTGLIMRYLDAGNTPGAIESPHQVRISPDGKYWYVVFVAGSVVEKYSTATDEKLASINIGFEDWNTIGISPDGKMGYAVATFGNKIAIIDLENEAYLGSLPVSAGSGSIYPHGIVVSADGGTLYVTDEGNSKLHKIDVSDLFGNGPNYSTIDLVQGQPVTTGNYCGAHEVAFSPDSAEIWLTCKVSHEVRVLDAAAETLKAVIPVGQQPLEMDFSASKNLVFVAHTDDETTFGDPNKKGAVYVIDMNTYSVVKTIYTGYQPHGIAVDEDHNRVWVAHRNISQGGPAPHHTSDCGGRNGYVTAIDLNSLELIPGIKIEVSVDPYVIGLVK